VVNYRQMPLDEFSTEEDETKRERRERRGKEKILPAGDKAILSNPPFSWDKPEEAIRVTEYFFLQSASEALGEGEETKREGRGKSPAPQT